MTQKLKTYTDESLIPTELKDFYAERNGKYEPQIEGVDSVSGVLAKNTELLGKVAGHATELAGKDAEIGRLSGQLANASSATIPRGHKAVPNADAELVEKIKEAGVTTVDAFAALKADHDKFKQEAEVATREKNLRDLGKAMGWDVDKTALLLSAFTDLPEIELRDGTEKDADGNLKKVAVAKVKGADNVVTEKSFADVIASTPRLNALVPALTTTKQADGTPLPSHGAGGGTNNAKPVETYINSTYSAPKRQSKAA